MKKINFNSLMLLALAIMGLTFTSCGDDPVPGCTDPDGDSYAEANNEDDGSCTYFGLFEGDYEGTFVCEGALAQLFSSANATLSKVADPNSISFLVMSSTLPQNVPVGGTITNKTTITLNQTLPGVPLEIIPDGNGGVVTGTEFDIIVTGTLERQDNGDLVGPLTFDLKEIAVNSQVPGTIPDLLDTCVYTASKQ